MTRGRESVLRGIGTAIVVGGAVWFVINWGPRPSPARGEIYASLSSYAGFPLPPPGSSTVVSERRPVRLNGMEFTYAVGRTEKRISEVMDHYYDQLLVGGNQKGGNWPTVPFRIDGAGIGVVAGVSRDEVLHPAPGGVGSTPPGAPGGPETGFDFNVVVAYQEAGTVFLHFSSGPKTGLSDLLMLNDVPEARVGPVETPASAEPLLVMEQGAPEGSSVTAFYRVPALKTGFAHYESKLSSTAWTRNPWLDGSSRDIPVLHFTSDKQEYLITALEEADDCLLAVIYRNRR